MMAGSGRDAIVGIWVIWDFDRDGSRGVMKNIFGGLKRHQTIDRKCGIKMTPAETARFAASQHGRK